MKSMKSFLRVDWGEEVLSHDLRNHLCELSTWRSSAQIDHLQEYRQRANRMGYARTEAVVGYRSVLPRKEFTWKCRLLTDTFAINNTVFWDMMSCRLVVIYRSCLPFACSEYSKNMKMVTVCSSEISVNFATRLCDVTSQKIVFLIVTDVRISALT
jgi:hypothetical protein